VLVGARRRGDRLGFEVWDTGLGIPASKRRLVFREFKRLDQGARVARGLGLGLSIVERIARVLDHPIALSSQPGRGSMFRVEAPVVAGEARSVVPIGAPRRAATPLSGFSVLAIDNEPAVLDGMRTLLGGWGCAVATAASLDEARATLEAAPVPPRVIIADYHLDRGQDGLAAIAGLRALLAPDHPAILLTADRSAGVRAAAEAMGVHVLHKPLKPAALRALLTQWRASRAAAE
jgi:CheY-like chemotaxis protein